MAEKDAEKPDVTITLTADTPLPAAEGANFFHFTRFGDEFQLVVGTMNLIELHDITAQLRPPTITPQITHRFQLSSFGFERLRASLHEMEKGMGLKGGGEA